MTSLQLGAPDGELFAERFEGLAERPPSEVQERLRKLAFPDEPAGDCIERTKQLMDKKYKAAQSTK